LSKRNANILAFSTAISLIRYAGRLANDAGSRWLQLFALLYGKAGKARAMAITVRPMPNTPINAGPIDYAAAGPWNGVNSRLTNAR
jgi:hypothetical protein